MRSAFAAVLVTTALLPAGLAAQTAAPPQQTAPTVAPLEPGQRPAAITGGGQAEQAGAQSGPADICRELVAFVQPAGRPSGATPAPAQVQEQGKTSSGATAVTAPPHSKAEADAARPSGEGAPTTSGMSGPVPRATTEGTPGPQAAGQSQFVTQPRPAPPDAATTPKPTAAMVDKALAAAAANDIAGCRSTAQEMRRAGVAMPPALIALAALELEYHLKTEPR
jgi:hypothetical protein